MCWNFFAKVGLSFFCQSRAFLSLFSFPHKNFRPSKTSGRFHLYNSLSIDSSVTLSIIPPTIIMSDAQPETMVDSGDAVSPNAYSHQLLMDQIAARLVAIDSGGSTRRKVSTLKFWSTVKSGCCNVDHVQHALTISLAQTFRTTGRMEEVLRVSRKRRPRPR